MKQIGGMAIAIVCVIVAVFIARSCGYHAGASDALARAADDSTDRRLARMATQQLTDGAAWRRERDSLARVARMSKRRADFLEAAIKNAPGDSVSKVDAVKALAAKDSVIAEDSSGIRARDIRILALESANDRYRLVEIPQLQRERDSWKKKALRPLGCVVGGGGAAGLSGTGNFTHSVIGFGGTVGLGVTCGLRL